MKKPSKSASVRLVSIAILSAVFSSGFFLSCKSAQKTTPGTLQIETTFPNPYDNDGNPLVEYDSQTDSVSMPLWYWIKITEYAIDTEANKELQEN